MTIWGGKGVRPGRCLTRGVYTSPSPPPRGQTDTCKNITFPQLLLRTVKYSPSTSHGLITLAVSGTGTEPRHGRMDSMALCRTFHTAPEEGQGPTPSVPIVLVSVPVPVADTASVITQSVQRDWAVRVVKNVVETCSLVLVFWSSSALYSKDPIQLLRFCRQRAAAALQKCKQYGYPWQLTLVYKWTVVRQMRTPWCTFNAWALFMKVTMENTKASGLLLAWGWCEWSEALRQHGDYITK